MKDSEITYSYNYRKLKEGRQKYKIVVTLGSIIYWGVFMVLGIQRVKISQISVGSRVDWLASYFEIPEYRDGIFIGMTIIVSIIITVTLLIMSNNFENIDKVIFFDYSLTLSTIVVFILSIFAYFTYILIDGIILLGIGWFLGLVGLVLVVYVGPFLLLSLLISVLLYFTVSLELSIPVIVIPGLIYFGVAQIIRVKLRNKKFLQKQKKVIEELSTKNNRILIENDDQVIFESKKEFSHYEVYKNILLVAFKNEVCLYLIETIGKTDSTSPFHRFKAKVYDTNELIVHNDHLYWNARINAISKEFDQKITIWNLNTKEYVGSLVDKIDETYNGEYPEFQVPEIYDYYYDYYSEAYDTDEIDLDYYVSGTLHDSQFQATQEKYMKNLQGIVISDQYIVLYSKLGIRIYSTNSLEQLFEYRFISMSICSVSLRGDIVYIMIKVEDFDQMRSKWSTIDVIKEEGNIILWKWDLRVQDSKPVRLEIDDWSEENQNVWYEILKNHPEYYDENYKYKAELSTILQEEISKHNSLKLYISPNRTSLLGMNYKNRLAVLKGVKLDPLRELSPERIIRGKIRNIKSFENIFYVLVSGNTIYRFGNMDFS